jgi:hypothetical protein
MRTAPILRHRPTRLAPGIILLAIGLASWPGAAPGRAGNLVEFPNLSDHAPTRLLGYLARPEFGLSGLLSSHSDRAGPYPAVVVLHGCGGFSSHSAHIADQMGGWGYVSLTVASDIAARTPEAIGSRRFRLTTKNVRALLHNEPERGNPVLVPVSHLFWSLLCRPGKAGEGVPVPNVRFAPLE